MLPVIIPNKQTGGSNVIPVNYPDKYKEVVNEILPQYVVDKDNINGTIAMLIKSKKDDRGNTLFKTVMHNGKEVNIRQLSDEQGVLAFVQKQHTTPLIGQKVTINGVTRDATYLDAFFSIIHPKAKLKGEALVGNVTGDARNVILADFNTVSKNNFTEAMNLIMGFTDLNEEMVKNAMRTQYGSDLTNVKVLGEIKGKSTSAFNAMTTIDAMLATYLTDDGKNITMNTQQGALIVKASGMYETAKRALKLFKGGRIVDILAESVDDVNDSLVDATTIYDSIESTDADELAAREKNKTELAKIKRMMKGDFGESDGWFSTASGFVKSLNSEDRELYKKGKLGKEVIRKLAIRQYHKYMLAYQLAAAIQGGTGGRTISDQDVQNIMNALNFGFFTEAYLERETLLQARKMMQGIYEYNTALASKDPQKMFAAIKAQQLLWEGKDFGFLGVGDKNNQASIAARRKFVTDHLKIPRNNQLGKDDKKDSERSKIEEDELELIRERRNQSKK